jgi:hypothetical protein
LLVLGAGAGAASSPTYSLSNPSINIPAVPNILSGGWCTGGAGAWTCTNPCITTSLTWPTYSNTVACTSYALAAINNARGEIGEPTLVLPSNWYTLTIPEQLLVMADMERVSDGYPAYIGLNADLSTEAQTAATLNTDPGAAPGFSMGNDASNTPGMGGSWSEGTNVLFADYFWMYADGWGGSVTTTSNIACTSSSSLGCWGHRDELLGTDPGYNPGVGLGCTNCEMGAGYAVVNGGSSYVDLIELPAGPAPATTFSWSSEQAFFPGGLPYTPADPTVTTTTLVPSVGLDIAPTSMPVGLALTMSKPLFNTGELDVAWTTGTQTDRESILEVYKGATCGSLLRAVTTTLNSVTQGVVGIAHKKYFSTKFIYSARVMVFGTNGAPYTDGCLDLGRP